MSGCGDGVVFCLVWTLDMPDFVCYIWLYCHGLHYLYELISAHHVYCVFSNILICCWFGSIAVLYLYIHTRFIALILSCTRTDSAINICTQTFLILSYLLTASTYIMFNNLYVSCLSCKTFCDDWIQNIVLLPLSSLFLELLFLAYTFCFVFLIYII